MKLYAWNTLNADQLNARISRKAVHSENMTIARLELQKYATVTEHSHVHEQISIVERGALKFFLSGREQIVRAGEFLVLAPHEPHAVEVLEDSIIVDIFSPGREDWVKGDDAYLRR